MMHTVFRYASAAITLWWPPLVLATTIVAAFLWARRRRRPWIAALVLVPIVLIGYSLLGGWLGSYGLGLVMATQEHGRACALKVIVFRPDLVPNAGELWCATGPSVPEWTAYCR